MSFDENLPEFGSYYGEKITWHVLKRENGRALIISEYAPDCKPYHNSPAAITWEQCDLRKWLNSEFLNTAFSAEEQERIISTHVVNTDNPRYGTPGGNDTTDKIFLLSLAEAEMYFADDDDRKCRPTKYAEQTGALTSNGYCVWWLRSPGDDSDRAAYVNIHYGGPIHDGGISDTGYIVLSGNYAVRPALWIRL